MADQRVPTLASRRRRPPLVRRSSAHSLESLGGIGSLMLGPETPKVTGSTAAPYSHLPPSPELEYIQRDNPAGQATPEIQKRHKTRDKHVPKISLLSHHPDRHSESVSAGLHVDVSTGARVTNGETTQCPKRKNKTMRQLLGFPLLPSGTGKVQVPARIRWMVRPHGYNFDASGRIVHLEPRAGGRRNQA